MDCFRDGSVLRLAICPPLVARIQAEQQVLLDRLERLR
jgi:hypothetical protein